MMLFNSFSVAFRPVALADAVVQTTLFSSFSATYKDNIPSDGIADTTIFRSFSVTSLLINPSIPFSVVCSYFSLTIPELAVIEAQRDPFGLITHKKK